MFGSSLHHVGIIVPDPERLEELMSMLGLRAGRRYYVPEYEAECVFTEGAGAVVEFIVPTGPRLARFNKGMGGLHHIALLVPDLEAAAAALHHAGIDLLEKQPIEAGPIRINFIPPAYTRGLIVELVDLKARPRANPGAEMTDPLFDRIQAATARYPLAAGLCSQVLESSSTILRGQLQYLLDRHGESFWQRAEELVGLAKGMGGSPARSLVEYTLAYLKEQVRFMGTAAYSHENFDDVRREVYDNADVMEGFYLEGLMLTHAFWPIHFEMHDFFVQQFLPHLPDQGFGAEYGFGHGLYLLEVLRRRPHTAARGFDISPFSRRYAERLLSKGGIARERFQLGFADVRTALDCPDGVYRWAIFAEIIEHIPDPHFSLRELRRTMTPDAPLFATTVVNSNAIDHLYLFQDVEGVRQLFRDTGFRIVAESVLRVADYGDKKSRDPSIDVAVVCVPQ